MLSLNQLANELNRERLAHAEQRRPARRHLAFRRASRRADRAERRMRNAARKALRLRTELEPNKAVNQPEDSRSSAHPGDTARKATQSARLNR